MTGEELKALQAATSGLGEVVRLAKESPEAREAGRYAARSLRIITQTVHNALLPLAAGNYAVERFADYMRQRFAPELAEALADVPSENIEEPRPTIAGPVLDALVYAHEEPNVRRLYVSLLATAMDSSRGDEHPAFVEVLRQLDVRELPYLRAVLSDGPGAWPIVRLYLDSDSGALTLHNHFLDWSSPSDSLTPDRATAYVDNWIRLGLVEADYTQQLAAQGAYDWVEGRPEYADLERRAAEGMPGAGTAKVWVRPGILTRTRWGEMFASAVRIAEVPEGTVSQRLGEWYATALETMQRDARTQERVAPAGPARLG